MPSVLSVLSLFFLLRLSLAELGIDLSVLGAMNPEEWAEAVEQTNIEVERGNGKKVRIFCE